MIPAGILSTYYWSFCKNMHKFSKVEAAVTPPTLIPAVRRVESTHDESLISVVFIVQGQQTICNFICRDTVLLGALHLHLLPHLPHHVQIYDAIV